MRLPLIASAVGLLAVQGPTLVAEFPSGKFEALGACDIRSDGVACWDMAGKPSADLADAVRAALTRSGAEVQFRFGLKNRHLVVRRPQKIGVSYRMGANDYAYSSISAGGDPEMDFLRVAVAPSQTSTVLQVLANVQSDRDVDLSLRSGSRASIDGWDVEVGDSQKVVPKPGEADPNGRRYDPYGQAPATDYWTIVIGLKGREGEYAQWGYAPLDAAGQPIRYVDAGGKPITAIKALALEPSLQPGPGNGYPAAPSTAKRKAYAAYFQGAGPGPAFRATTNIDPKAIATLRIRASHQESKSLGPFPLDPR